MYSKFISLRLIKVSKPIFNSKYNRRTVSSVITIAIADCFSNCLMSQEF